jgi:hypothetical protein
VQLPVNVHDALTYRLISPVIATLCADAPAGAVENVATVSQLDPSDEWSRTINASEVAVAVTCKYAAPPLVDLPELSNDAPLLDAAAAATALIHKTGSQPTLDWQAVAILTAPLTDPLIVNSVPYPLKALPGFPEDSPAGYHVQTFSFVDKASFKNWSASEVLPAPKPSPVKVALFSPITNFFAVSAKVVTSTVSALTGTLMVSR